MSSTQRIASKKSGQILMLIGGLLLLTIILVWAFQEQIGKSWLNVTIVVFVVFVLVARAIFSLIDLRNTA